MERLKKLRGPLIALLVCAVPYVAYKYGGQLTGPTDKSKDLLDESVPGLFAVMATDGSYVEYQNGTRVRLETFGLSLVTWADQQNAPDRFKTLGVEIVETDFPIIVFFNASGFDASGGVQVIRRARDGSVVYMAKNKAKLVKAAVAKRDGTFKLYFWDWSDAVVEEKEWYERYVGVEPVPTLPSPDELDKLTPEQLKKFGIERLTKDEYDKKFGKPPEAKKENSTAPEQGVRGRIVLLPGLNPVETEMRIFAGKLDPKNIPAKEKAVAVLTTGKDGTYKATLPDGTYTITVKQGDGWRGNAVSTTTWPTVEVKGKWVDDYDFRLSPK